MGIYSYGPKHYNPNWGAFSQKRVKYERNNKSKDKKKQKDKETNSVSKTKNKY